MLPAEGPHASTRAMHAAAWPPQPQPRIAAAATAAAHRSRAAAAHRSHLSRSHRLLPASSGEGAVR